MSSNCSDDEAIGFLVVGYTHVDCTYEIYCIYVYVCALRMCCSRAVEEPLHMRWWSARLMFPQSATTVLHLCKARSDKEWLAKVGWAGWVCCAGVGMVKRCHCSLACQPLPLCSYCSSCKRYVVSGQTWQVFVNAWYLWNVSSSTA